MINVFYKTWPRISLRGIFYGLLNNYMLQYLSPIFELDKQKESNYS